MNRSVFGSGRSGERLHWSAFVSGRRDGAPGALFQLTPGAVSRSARARVQGTWQDVAVAGWPLRFTAWWEDIVEAYRSPGVIRSDVRYGERFIGASVQSEIAAGALRGAWQIEAAHERLSGEDFIKPRYSFGARHRSLAAVRLNGTVTRDVGRGLRVVAAGSYARDMDDQFGGFDSPRAMAALSRPGMWRLAVGAGRSFHRPLLTSLFWKRDAFSEGNPLLRPEHGAELEATGSVTPVRGLELQTRYYRRRVTDIIVWERDHLGRFRPRNYDRADITGRDDRVTFEMLGQSLSLVYGHAFQIATDRSGERNHDGKTLIFRPRHTHTGTVRASVGRLTVQWRGRWVSRRFIRRMNNKVLGPFRMIDLDVHLRIHTRRPNVLLRLRGENVTDEWVELIERYPEPGRRYSVGMEFGW